MHLFGLGLALQCWRGRSRVCLPACSSPLGPIPISGLVVVSGLLGCWAAGAGLGLVHLAIMVVLVASKRPPVADATILPREVAQPCEAVTLMVALGTFGIRHAGLLTRGPEHALRYQQVMIGSCAGLQATPVKGCVPGGGGVGGNVPRAK